MKRLLIVYLWSFTGLHFGFCQNNTQALLISLDGRGYVQRNEKQLDLKQPGLFIANDLIRINEGIASILTADGSEIIIKEGQSFQVPQQVSNNYLAFGEISEKSSKMQAYILRGEDSFVFPTKSNLTYSNKLQLNWKQIDSTVIVTFTIYKSGTETIVWQKENISDSFVIVDNNLPRGDYYWTLEGVNGVFTEIGEFTITNEIVCGHSHSDSSTIEVLKTLHCFLQKEYYFEAMLLLNAGIKKHGENSIFAWKKKLLTIPNN
jgi:hypothetical protein